MTRSSLLTALLLLASACPKSSSDTADPAGDTAAGDTAAGDDTGSQPPAEIGPAGEFDVEVTVDGVVRDYVLYVPSSATQAMETGPVPVLITLHGAGDTGSNFIHATGLTSTADDLGFVLVGPDAYGGAWFLQDNEGWPGADGSSMSLQNDMELMLSILSDLHDSYYINDGRVFAAGHSRGAGFTALMGILSSQLDIASGPWVSPFTAYGINAGYDPAGGGYDMATASPKAPVWVIHGTSDTTVPYSYGEDLAQEMEAAGWEVTFTPVSGASHSWLWRSSYGQSNEDLLAFFMAATD